MTKNRLTILCSFVIVLITLAFFYWLHKNIGGGAILGADKLQTELDSIFTTIETKESEYFTANKRYLQALSSHQNTDGSIKTTSNKTNKPADQVEDWSYFALPDTTYLTYSIDVYDSPKGSGYVIRANYADLLGVHSYHRHIGPDQDLDKDNNLWIHPAPLLTTTASI